MAMRASTTVGIARAAADASYVQYRAGPRPSTRSAAPVNAEGSQNILSPGATTVRGRFSGAPVHSAATPSRTTPSVGAFEAL